jgi:hypothetical protein
MVRYSWRSHGHFTIASIVSLELNLGCLKIPTLCTISSTNCTVICCQSVPDQEYLTMLICLIL